jgi:pimeloyl-ACP methyl ester carboxylesterase
MEKVSVNGLTVAYSRHGEGTPLVLIHGYPLDHSIWQDLLPHLEADFEVILPDLRGFGMSATTGAAYGMSDMADDIAGLLDRLEIEKAAIAGHSMGGYVALAFASKYSKRLSGLGLVASQALADSPDRKQGRYKTAEEVQQKGVGVVVEAMAPKLSAHPGVQNFARGLIARQGSDGIIGALKTMAERKDMTSVISSLKVPTALVHGDADALIPIERAREVKALVPSAHLTELPGVGHLPMMEAAEQTAEALKSLK